MSKSKKETTAKEISSPILLTPEEIQILKDSQQAANQIVVGLGQLEVQKSNLLKQLDRVQSDNQTFGKTLQEKYGDGNIDLEKGEFTPAE